jgi:hypothetical protein
MVKLNTLERNLAVINQRWPKVFQQLNTVDLDNISVNEEANTLVINNIQLTSNYDRIAEAKLQLTRIPLHSKKAFIYGPALGDTATLLLQRESLEKLHVSILNSAVFIHSLNVIDQQIWLNDNRTQLHLIETLDDVYSPFCANPAELILAQDSCAQLRDRVALELNHDYIQQKHANDKYTLQTPILKNIDFIKKDADISELPKPNTERIYVVAAGPTLESHFNWLRENNPFIIAVDAAVNPLITKGIMPNIIISIDELAYRLFSSVLMNSLKNIPLVYFPNVDSSLLSEWQGNRYCSYSRTQMYQGIPKVHKKTTLFSAGSVIHPAVDLAVYLQAKEVILLGADFSFTHNKSHANANKSNHSKISLEQAKHWVINSHGEKVPTLANFKGYLRDLERFIKQNKQVKFFNGSSLGAKIEGADLWRK